MVGQFAVAQGRSHAEKVLDRTFAQAQATLRHLGLLSDEAPAGPTTTAEPATEPRAPRAPRPDPVRRPVRPATSSPATSSPGATEDAPEAVTLAIPDYESLSASQVVPRLSSLSAEELEAVGAYEDAHRGRKTILNKVTQLSGH
jgi:hypothetical protein